MVYKLIFTLPPTSATVEQCLSKFKLIKTKLRSTVGETKLNDLMEISCNLNLDVSFEDNIDKSYLTSGVFQKFYFRVNNKI